MLNSFTLASLISILTISSVSYSQESQNLDNIWEVFEKGHKQRALNSMMSISNKSISKMSYNQRVNYYCNLGKMQLHFNRYEDAIRNLLKGNQISENHKTKQERLCHTGLADLFEQIGAFELSIEQKRLINDDLGGVFYKMGLVDSAAFHFKKELSRLDASDHIAYTSALNNLGLVFMLKEDHETAIGYFLSALEMVNAFNIERSLFNIEGNLGYCYFGLGDYTNSEKYLRSYFNGIVTTSGVVKSARLEATLVSCYIKLSRMEDAQRVLSDFKQKSPKISSKARIDLILSEIDLASALGDHKKVFDLTRRLRVLRYENDYEKKRESNESSAILVNYLVNESEERIKEEQLKIEAAIEVAELKDRELKTWLFIGFILFVVFVVSIYSIALKLKNSKMQSSIEKQERLLGEERLKLKINEQKHSLLTSAYRVHSSLDFNKELLSEIAKLQNSDSIEPGEDLKALITSLKVTISNEKVDTKILESVNMAQLEFREQLKARHPVVSEADIELAMLVKLGLTNKEIGHLRNISSESAKKAKNRLKKKFDIPVDMNLFDYLQNLEL